MLANWSEPFALALVDLHAHPPAALRGIERLDCVAFECSLMIVILTALSHERVVGS